WTRGGRGGKRLETRTRDVKPRSLPRLRRAFDRLPLRRAEQACAALLRRGARDVRLALDPPRPLRAKHLEAEARPRRRDRAQVARRPGLPPKQHRRRVVAL